MEPLVSICCITYNHEKYIADALDSFLMQQVSFSYEIIVHDDASTDKTAKIIREYEKNYPSIIKPIYQTENQYSKGKKPLRDFVLPLVKGKYMATCEGDDFWIDTEKLKKQVQFLEENQTFIACFHAVKVVNTDKSPTGRYLGLYRKGSQVLSINDAGLGGVVHVSSRLLRTDFYRKEYPEWIYNSRYGDIALALYLAIEGKVYYMDRVMSAYRIGVENSMMTNHRKTNHNANEINLHHNILETLKIADEYYNYRYHKEIEQIGITSHVTINLLSNDFSSVAIKNYCNYIKQKGLIGLVKIFLLRKAPFVVKIFGNLKKKILMIKMNG
jgi:glycosyltransferase involved in cell wall biosynthesis